MNAIKIIGIVLIVAGALGLGYKQFTYTEETHDVDVGPVEFEVKDKETVKVPTWIGVGVIVAGVVLLVIPYKVKKA